MPMVMPGQSNTYVPVALAGDKLTVDFARDPKRFKVARYSQVIPVEKDTGYYLYLSPDEAGRILNADLRDFVWYDGADAPRRHDSNREFEFRPYRTQALLLRICPWLEGSRTSHMGHCRQACRGRSPKGNDRPDASRGERPFRFHPIRFGARH